MHHHQHSTLAWYGDATTRVNAPVNAPVNYQLMPPPGLLADSNPRPYGPKPYIILTELSQPAHRVHVKCPNYMRWYVRLNKMYNIYVIGQ